MSIMDIHFVRQILHLIRWLHFALKITYYPVGLIKAGLRLLAVLSAQSLDTYSLLIKMLTAKLLVRKLGTVSDLSPPPRTLI